MIWIAALVAKRAAIFTKHATIRRTRHIFKAKGGALRHSYQSVALLVGEKQHTCRHVFKCRCGAFVDSF